jgi:hypothetical protein
MPEACFLLPAACCPQVLKFAAFKDEPVQSLLLDASALRLATCSSSCVKLWDLARLTCLAEHQLSAPATSMVSMAGARGQLA